MDQDDHQSPAAKAFLPGQPKSLAGIALRAFCLGLALAGGLVGVGAAVAWTESPLWRLPFFAAALAAFHFLEFWTTAAYNTPAATVDSFLLTANWPAYAVAHASAFVECFVAFHMAPWHPLQHVRVAGVSLATLLVPTGLALVVVGQLVRSAAMVHCGTNFNHNVQQHRRAGHQLVSTGIYGYMRHPSYFGFWWWALGTQLVLGNMVCSVAYAAVLWRFFDHRIRVEERFLVSFFGDEYVQYRRRVGTKLPFIA